MNWTARPAADEYPEYYETYVSKVPAGHLLETLAAHRDRTAAFLRNLSEEQAEYRYQEGKWSLKEVMGHVVDAERVFAIRALYFARKASEKLPPFDENEWGITNRAHERPISDIADEFEHVRNSSISLYSSLGGEEAGRRGVASGVEFTTRSVAFITSGHEIHHMGVIRDRYVS